MPGEAAQTRTVLVADRDPAVRTLIRESFGRLGYATLEADEGRAALERMRGTTPALVICEVALPGVSGYELCREVKDEYGSKLPFILTSAERTEAFDRVGGLLVGADDYIVKPFHSDEVLARARRLLGGNGAAQPAESRLDALTPRESEVLDLLLDGLSQEEMAAQLVISPKTVSTHLQRILAKLGVHSRAQAVAVALRERGGGSSRAGEAAA